MLAGAGAYISVYRAWRRSWSLSGGGVAQINLEIKGQSVQETVTTAAAILEPVLGTWRKTSRPRVLVSSFAHPAVALLKEELPWLRVGVLMGQRMERSGYGRHDRAGSGLRR